MVHFLTISTDYQAGPAYAEAFLSVVRNVTKEDTVQYVLALLDDMLTGQQLSNSSHEGHKVLSRRCVSLT